MRSKTTINWLFNDVLCYLFIAFFDWKIGFFQQTHVRVYDILKTGMANVLWAITLLFEYNSDYQILWIRFMRSFNTLSLFNKSLYSQCFHLDLSIYNIHLVSSAGLVSSRVRNFPSDFQFGYWSVQLGTLWSPIKH